MKIPVKIKSKSEENSELKIIQKPLKEILKKLNDKIIKKDLRDKQIGHSYFLRVNNIDDLKFVFRYEIIPLLQDYFYGNYEELEKILGTRFISKDEMTINDNVLKDSDKFSTALGYLFEKDE